MESLGSLIRKRRASREKNTTQKQHCCNCGDLITTKFPCQGNGGEYYCDGCLMDDRDQTWTL